MRAKVVTCFLLSFGFLLLFTSTAHGYGWGFVPSEKEKRPDVGKYEEILKGYHAYYAEITDEKNLYLTFDNGYEQGYTPEVLRILKKHQVPATFFVTGHYVKEEPELIQQMVKDGHIVGNHSDTHPDFTQLSKEEIKEELDRVEKEVAQLTDQKEMAYVRPPRGTFTKDTVRWLEELGYVQVFWSVAFKDWEVDRQKGWKYAYDEMMKQVHPGAIVLLHTVSKDNAEALERMIISLKERGYTFKSLDDLMVKELVGPALFLQ